MGQVAAGVAGMVLLLATGIGLVSMARRSRRFLHALHVANVNRNAARAGASSAARATAGVDFGGVHLHVPGGSGTTAHELDDDERAIVAYSLAMHRAGRFPLDVLHDDDAGYLRPGDGDTIPLVSRRRGAGSGRFGLLGGGQPDAGDVGPGQVSS